MFGGLIFPQGEHALDALENAINHEMEVDAFLNGRTDDMEEAFDKGIIDALGVTDQETLKSREAFTKIFDMG